jgi:hypothetical protein
VGVPAATREFLAERHPEALELALWVRELLLAAEPDLSERVYQGWDGIGFRHPDAGYICAIYPRAADVRLLFGHGVRLDDPDGCSRARAPRPATSPCAQSRTDSPRRSHTSFAMPWPSASSVAERRNSSVSRGFGERPGQDSNLRPAA